MSKPRKNPSGRSRLEELEQFFEPIAPIDYSEPGRIERMTEKVFREAAANAREAENEDVKHRGIRDLDAARKKRRKNAALRTMDKVQELVGGVCPDAEPRFYIVEEWAEINAFSACSSYDQIEARSACSLAAAIWMLDHLRESGHWAQAMQLLPLNGGEPEDTDIPDVHDPCFSDELLRAMVCVIRSRNSDCTGLKAKKYAANGTRIYTDDYTAAGKQHQDVPSRRRFEALLSLIGESAIRTAAAHFEEKLWECTRRYYIARADSARRENDYAIKYNAFAGKLKNHLDDLRQSREDSIAQEARRLGAEQGVPFALPDITESISALCGPRSKLDSFHTMMNLFTEGKALTEYNDQLNQDLQALRYSFCHFGNLSRSALDEELGSDALDQICGFEVEDPYEIAFAALYLLDTDSDLPWLYYPALSVMRRAETRLPWFFQNYSASDDPFWPETGTLAGAYTPPAAGKNQKIPEPLDWYRQQYRFRARGGTSDLERSSLAQIVYRLTGCIPPRRSSRYDAAVSTLTHYGVTGKKIVAPLLQCISLLGEERHRMDAGKGYAEAFPEEEEESAPEQSAVAPEVYQDTIRRLRTENDQLKKALHESGREARDIRRKLETQSEIWQRERLELQDFRELFFHQGEEEEEREPEPAPAGTEFPYAVQKRTVVFGGHDSWVKVIRPMLPDVRFVGREAQPNANMIRNADVIWIQSNALAHKHYYKIIDVARTYRITVRYFGYASAEKCAEQLAAEDQK